MHWWFAQRQKHKYDRKDEIEVETGFDVAGKNGTRRDWIIRDHYTKEIITRATRCKIFHHFHAFFFTKNWDEFESQYSSRKASRFKKSLHRCFINYSSTKFSQIQTHVWDMNLILTDWTYIYGLLHIEVSSIYMLKIICLVQHMGNHE